MMREIFVAETRQKAKEIARPYLEEKYKVYHQWDKIKQCLKVIITWILILMI